MWHYHGWTRMLRHKANEISNFISPFRYKGGHNAHQRGNMKRKPVLIGCKIFKEEYDAIIRNNSEFPDVNMIWVDAGLHSDPDVIEREISSIIESHAGSGEEIAGILFGRGCVANLCAGINWRKTPVLPVKNCISAFVGDERAKELEKNKTMILTPSWVRVWPENMKQSMGWNEVDFRMNLGRYDRILILDSGINPLSEEETLEFYDLVQVPVEFESIRLDYFMLLIKNFF